jgi:hypothetical protein
LFEMGGGMNAIRTLVVIGMTGVTLLLAARQAPALQELGQFRWQFASFCNVVTLSVVQEGSTFALAGFDDNCGGSNSAAFGTASLNPDGTAAMGLTIVMQNGVTDHFNILLNLATLSGTWQSASGKTGVFFFNPPSPAAGSPRPAPTTGPLTSGTTLRGTYHVRFQAAAPGADGASPISFGFTLPSAPAVNVVGQGGASTPNCPGTAANPQAAAGQLCVYVSGGTNVSALIICTTGRSFFCGEADPFGTTVLIEATAAGETGSFGSWAVTVP